MDRLLLFFINFIASVQYLADGQTVDAAGGKVDRDCNRNCGSCSAVLIPAGAAAVTGGLYPSSVATRFWRFPSLSSDWKIFSRAEILTY